MDYRLYLGSIPGNLGQEELLGVLSSMVTVQNIRLFTGNSPSESKNKGYAYIKVSSNHDMQLLLDNPPVIGGRRLKVQVYKDGVEREIQQEQCYRRRLYISNLPLNCRDDEIHRFFEERFGAVESAYRVKQMSTKSRMSYGYVTFHNEEDAAKVLSCPVPLAFKNVNMNASKYNKRRNCQDGRSKISEKPSEGIDRALFASIIYNLLTSYEKEETIGWSNEGTAVSAHINQNLTPSQALPQEVEGCERDFLGAGSPQVSMNSPYYSQQVLAHMSTEQCFINPTKYAYSKPTCYSGKPIQRLLERYHQPSSLSTSDSPQAVRDSLDYQTNRGYLYLSQYSALIDRNHQEENLSFNIPRYVSLTEARSPI